MVRTFERSTRVQPRRFSNYSRELEQRICQTRLMSGTSKNVRISRVSCVAVWFRTSCDEDRCRHTGKASECRLAAVSKAHFFILVLEELCAYLSRAMAADDSVSLERLRVAIRSWRKEYCSYNELEELVRELPRDTEIGALFKAESATKV